MWKDYKCSGKRVNKKLKSYVVLDTETTGLEPKEDEVIQLSMLKIENGEVKNCFNKFYKSHKNIPDRVSKLNGITEEMVKDKPYLEDSLEEIEAFIGNSSLIGHNIGFDLNFLEKYFLNKLNKKILNSWDDTMKLSKENFYSPKYSLDFLSSRFNHRYFPSHNSLDDCYATYELYERISEKFAIYEDKIKK